jgi:hypothetical protein
MKSRRRPEIIAGRVNADGTIAAGDGFTVQKTGTGAYVVTITASGFRLVGVAATAAAGGNFVVSLGGWASSAFNVQTQIASTSAITDTGFSFIAVGVQT